MSSMLLSLGSCLFPSCKNIFLLIEQQPTWFHYGCFFKKNKPKQLADIAGFDCLRWEDQEKIKQHFSGSSAVSSAPASVDEVDAQLSDYQVDYAKSNRSKCKVCEDKISKEELRIAIMVDGDSKFTGGKIPAWHHISCFVEKKESEREHANVSEQIIAGCLIIVFHLICISSISNVFII